MTEHDACGRSELLTPSSHEQVCAHSDYSMSRATGFDAKSSMQVSESSS